MTYREMTFGDDLKISSVKDLATEKSVLHSVLANQSPVMKFWFLVMIANLAMFLFIIR
jgi:hypothetical protein